MSWWWMRVACNQEFGDSGIASLSSWSSLTDIKDIYKQRDTSKPMMNGTKRHGYYQSSDGLGGGYGWFSDDGKGENYAHVLDGDDTMGDGEGRREGFARRDDSDESVDSDDLNDRSGDELWVGVGGAETMGAASASGDNGWRGGHSSHAHVSDERRKSPNNQSAHISGQGGRPMAGHLNTHPHKQGKSAKRPSNGMSVSFGVDDSLGQDRRVQTAAVSPSKLNESSKRRRSDAASARAMSLSGEGGESRAEEPATADLHKMVPLTIQCRYDPSRHDPSVKVNIYNIPVHQMHINSDKKIKFLVEMLRLENEIPSTTGVNLYILSGGRMTAFSYTIEHEDTQLQTRLREIYEDEDAYNEVMNDTHKLRIVARLRTSQMSPSGESAQEAARAMSPSKGRGDTGLQCHSPPVSVPVGGNNSHTTAHNVQPTTTQADAAAAARGISPAPQSFDKLVSQLVSFILR